MKILQDSATLVAILVTFSGCPTNVVIDPTEATTATVSTSNTSSITTSTSTSTTGQDTPTSSTTTSASSTTSSSSNVSTGDTAVLDMGGPCLVGLGEPYSECAKIGCENDCLKDSESSVCAFPCDADSGCPDLCGTKIECVVDRCVQTCDDVKDCLFGQECYKNICAWPTGPCPDEQTCDDGYQCIGSDCVLWPQPGEKANCLSTPLPGEVWGPCDADLKCENGEACLNLNAEVQICPAANDAMCIDGECGPKDCTGGFCRFGSTCFPPCSTNDDCPYNGMVCAYNAKGNICGWQL